MAHICGEILNSTQSAMYNELRQGFLNAGWVEHYTISTTSRVFKSNGADDLQPPLYLHIFISGNIYIYMYQHWSGAAGVCSIINSYYIQSSITSIRFYINKAYFYITNSPYTSYVAYFFWPISPLRIAQTVGHSITGGTTVNITIPSVKGFRVGDYKNIYGAAGEGQQEIRITAIDTVNKIITVTGCTNSYAVGAIVGDYIVVAIVAYSGNMTNQFNYNKVGTALTNSYGYIYGKNGNVGQIYTHENYIILETAVYVDTNRYYGEVNSTYVKTAKGASANDIIQINNSDAAIVDSLVTSFTAYTLTDTTKNWEPDTLIGKTVIFISGTGSGYTRYIIGNTNNTLTFRKVLHTIDTTTGYRVVDEAYRVLYNPGIPLAVKEEL